MKAAIPTASQSKRFQRSNPLSSTGNVFLSASVQYLVKTKKALAPNGSKSPLKFSHRTSRKTCPLTERAMKSKTRAIKDASSFRQITAAANKIAATKKVLGKAKIKIAFR